jgi:hypothetical protein
MFSAAFLDIFLSAAAMLLTTALRCYAVSPRDPTGFVI